MMDEMLPDYTPQERKNVELVREYMGIAYNPKRANAKNVAHLCAPDNVFTAPTTFPRRSHRRAIRREAPGGDEGSRRPAPGQLRRVLREGESRLSAVHRGGDAL